MTNHRVFEHDIIRCFGTQLIVGYELLVIGYWLLVIGYWLEARRYEPQATD
ncbi:hypothetical protein [Saccharicrinis sp. 156]|uniref:hypothetical protein n=1 Tax=Saccharicrinis sp. 156 TaxID=3417574 RepID=UPI003D342E60